MNGTPTGHEGDELAPQPPSNNGDSSSETSSPPREQPSSQEKKSGLVVDDAIVIAENVFSHVEQGKDPLSGSIDGTSQVVSGVIASFLTTIAAFLI